MREELRYILRPLRYRWKVSNSFYYTPIRFSASRTYKCHILWLAFLPPLASGPYSHSSHHQERNIERQMFEFTY